MTEIAKDRPAKGTVPNISTKKLKELWSSQRRTDEIASELRVSLQYLYSLARYHDLPRRDHVQRRPPAGKEIDPTPEEIIARSAEVRARWSEKEHGRNSVYKQNPVEVRSFSFNGRVVGFSEISHEF